jgi:hypothetical protein
VADDNACRGATGNGLQVNPGAQTVYDPVTNITWLANANLAATNTFGLLTCKDPTTPALCVAPDGARRSPSTFPYDRQLHDQQLCG